MFSFLGQRGKMMPASDVLRELRVTVQMMMPSGIADRCAKDAFGNCGPLCKWWCFRELRTVVQMMNLGIADRCAKDAFGIADRCANDTFRNWGPLCKRCCHASCAAGVTDHRANDVALLHVLQELRTLCKWCCLASCAAGITDHCAKASFIDCNLVIFS